MRARSADMAVVGNANLALGRGNLVLNNSSVGISASGNVLVAGNTVTGQTNSGAVGIASSGATVTDNLVYLNFEGIGGSGALRNLSDVNSWAGPVTLATNSTIGATSGSLRSTSTWAIAISALKAEGGRYWRS